MSSDINKSCPLYYQGLYVEKVNQVEAKISMCCFQKLNSVPCTSIDFDGDSYLNRIREHGGIVDECNVCILNERSGNQSYRQGQVKAFDQDGIVTRKTPELVSLTYNCENVCNLTCITCGPRFSRAWNADYKKLRMPVFKEKTVSNKNDILHTVNLSKVQLLHFQGGEPFLTDDHKTILRRIQSTGNINNLTLSYNTNGTIFPDPETVQYWARTKLTKIYFSIDAIGDQFDYIRFPAIWDQVTENMTRIRDLNLPPLWIEIGITVSLANLFYLQDIIDWAESHFSNLNNGDPIKLYINFCGDISVGGDLLSLRRIPKKMLSAAIEYVSSLSDDGIKNAVLGYLHHITHLDGCEVGFEEYLDNLDQLRGTSWRKTLHKLAKIV